MSSKSKLFGLLLSIAILTACGDETPDRGERTLPVSTQPTLRLKMISGGNTTYGDTLRFVVEPQDPALEIESVEIHMTDGSKKLTSSANGNIVLPTTLTGGGNLKLKVEARFTDGQTSTRYKDFSVAAAERPELWNFKVVRRYPHDTKSFTQGLLIHKGFLYEGTGNLGESRLRKIELATGNVLLERKLDDDYFGEGITIFDNKIYQLTYTTSRGFVYDLETFEPIDEFTYNTYTNEGWGLTHNDTSLIASDGSAILYFFDPVTYQETSRIRVFNDRGEVSRLNELEYHNGIIYANIYTSSEIIAIDAATGQVLHEYTARGMVERAEITTGMDVLNGIAVNPLNGNLLITGKYWSTIYEVTTVPRSDS